MTSLGMIDVPNPSELFMSSRYVLNVRAQVKHYIVAYFVLIDFCFLLLKIASYPIFLVLFFSYILLFSCMHFLGRISFIRHGSQKFSFTDISYFLHLRFFFTVLRVKFISTFTKELALRQFVTFTFMNRLVDHKLLKDIDSSHLISSHQCGDDRS